MTKRKIEWDKLNTSIESSDKYDKALEKFKVLDTEILNLKTKVRMLESAKQEEPDVPKELEEFGILSAIRLNPKANWNDEPKTAEAKIIGVAEDNLTVKVYYGYGKYDFITIVVPCNALKEKGYYFDEKTCYIICDYITSYEGFKFIMDAILKVEKLQKIKQLEYQKEQLAKCQEQINNLEKDLEIYNNVPLSKVEKIINQIGFAAHWSSSNDTVRVNFLDNLPRVYKI